MIQKGDTLFYAFYADDFNGTIELRGLPPKKTLTVYDYENAKNLGTVSSERPFLKAQFKKHLLIYVK